VKNSKNLLLGRWYPGQCKPITTPLIIEASSVADPTRNAAFCFQRLVGFVRSQLLLGNRDFDRAAIIRMLKEASCRFR
jgi:hypothetical protein